jgi:RNA recognition motif-containing protein
MYNGQGVPGTNVVFRLNWGSGGIRKVTGTEYSLFVGDLSPQVTDPMLLQCFSTHFRSTTSAKVITDAATGQSKGYGFVRFSDAFDCEDALTRMDGAIVGNRAIRVSPATAKKPDSETWAGRQHHGGQRTWTSGMHESGGNRDDNDGEEVREGIQPALVYTAGGGDTISNQAEDGGWNNMIQQPQQQQRVGGLGVETSLGGGGTVPHGTRNTTVFVGNLDASVLESDLQEHFQSYGGISSVKIPEGKGCGFVKYFHHVSARNAIAGLQGSMLGGCPLRLDWGKNHNRHHGQHQNGQQQHGLHSDRHSQGMSPMSPTGMYGSVGEMAEMNPMHMGYMNAGGMTVQTGQHHQQHHLLAYDGTGGLASGDASPQGQANRNVGAGGEGTWKCRCLLVVVIVSCCVRLVDLLIYWLIDLLIYWLVG